jgi:4-aminobutyrate aminotransferase/(S)-3-amino-2-methylpropionate transaminase
MDAAWPESRGEAIHTSTFLGHPVGCAMALAQIAEMADGKLPERAAKSGEILLSALQSKIVNPNLNIQIRGQGLIAGVELRSLTGVPATETALRAIKAMLRRGFILLPEGEHANVISFTPPLTITKLQLETAVDNLAEILKAEATGAHA